MGDRLAAGHQTLDLGTMVRIHVPQPNVIFTTECGLGGILLLVILLGKGN